MVRRRGWSNRKDPTKCKSGLHAWIPANLKKTARGFTTCRLCTAANNKKLARAQRAIAKKLTEAELVGRIHLNAYYWPRVEKREDGCWIWHGCKDGAGYGYVSVLHKPVSAHRIAYRLAHGDIPKKHEISHSCDTPLCVNPAHLSAVTHLENMRDCKRKGRWAGFPNHFDGNGNRKVKP